MLRLATFACATVLSAGIALAGECSTVRFGTDAGFEPFSFRDASGNLKGFEIDLVKAICARSKLDCSFAINDFDGLIPNLLTGKIDAAVATMSITDKRKEQIAFSDSYANPPARFVGMKGMTFELTPAFLHDKTVAVMRGQTSEDYMRQTFGDKVKVQLYDTQDNATQDLQNGRVDLVLNDAPDLYQGFLSRPEGKDYAFVSPDLRDPLFGSGYGFGLRKNDQCRFAEINKGLKAVRADGTYATLLKQWFSYSIE